MTHVPTPPCTAVRFSYDQMFAAMCIMEEMVDTNLVDAGSPWEEFRSQNGVAALRDAVIERLAQACNDDWERAYRAYEVASSDHTPTCRIHTLGEHCDCPAIHAEEPGSFDYEFVPTWLRTSVDWSDTYNGPRLKGSRGR